MEEKKEISELFEKLYEKGEIESSIILNKNEYLINIYLDFLFNKETSIALRMIPYIIAGGRKSEEINKILEKNSGKKN